MSQGLDVEIRGQVERVGLSSRMAFGKRSAVMGEPQNLEQGCG